MSSLSSISPRRSASAESASSRTLGYTAACTSSSRLDTRKSSSASRILACMYHVWDNMQYGRVWRYYGHIILSSHLVSWRKCSCFNLCSTPVCCSQHAGYSTGHSRDCGCSVFLLIFPALPDPSLLFRASCRFLFVVSSRLTLSSCVISTTVSTLSLSLPRQIP